MNSLITNDFFENSARRKELLELIRTLPDTNEQRNTDAYIKWVGIMEVCEILDLKAGSLLDVGCGTGPLDEYFTRFFQNVHAIDKDPVYGAHPLMYDRIRSGVNFICDDFLTNTTLPENTFDVIIDSCAIACGMDIEKTVQKISKLLKTGGHFITVGDTNLNTHSGNFMNPTGWIDTCKLNGLELVGEYTNITDNLFVVNENYGKYGKLNISRLCFQKKC